MPICAACGKEFKQWKGLRDHLLSGACSRPHQLRSLSTTPEAQVQSEALMALASFRAKVQGAPKQSLGGLASSPEAQELAQRCTICGFWTPDHTKVKSHLRQAHVKAWARDGPASLKMCQSFSPQMIKGHPCPFCRKTVYDKRKHPEQCVILFQVCFGWQRVHGTHETGDSRSAPKPDSAVTRSLHAFFKQPQKDGSNRPAVEESALIASRPRADTEVGPSAHVRTMQNIGNTCYVNATLQSLVAVLGADDTSAELEPLLHHCSNHSQEQRPLNPTGLFSLRSLMPRWKFDGRQLTGRC